jgi:hypothetical protein
MAILKPRNRAASVIRSLAALAVMAALSPGPAAGDASLEYAIKAAFLAKFTPYIDWPPASFQDATAPIKLCVLGPDPFGVALDRAAAGQRDARLVSVLRLASPELAASCQLVFIANAEAARELPAGLDNQPVLTVSDSEDVPAMIRFVVVQNHVRFMIDDGAARRSGLRISSRLLNLAVAVKRGRSP